MANMGGAIGAKTRLIAVRCLSVAAQPLAKNLFNSIADRFAEACFTLRAGLLLQKTTARRSESLSAVLYATTTPATPSAADHDTGRPLQLHQSEQQPI